MRKEQAADLELERRHFETPAAGTLAAHIRELHGLSAIYAGSAAGKWTEDDLRSLSSALKAVPRRQRTVLNQLSVAKVVRNNELEGRFICAEDGDQMQVTTGALRLSGLDSQVVILHEIGHGYVCHHPELVENFRRFLRGKSDLTTEKRVRAVCGRVVDDYVWADVETGGVEEYLVTAFAVAQVAPARVPVDLTSWLKRM